MNVDQHSRQGKGPMMLNGRTRANLAVSVDQRKITFPALLVALICWLQVTPAAASHTIELQFSDNLGSNIGDNLDIVITTTNAPGAYPSSGELITNITGTGALTYTFPLLGTVQYPLNLTGPNSNTDADNLLFATFPFIDIHGIGFHTDSLLGYYTDFTIRAVPESAGFRFDLCTSDCVVNPVNVLSFTLTSVAGAVPEPATWATLLIGFAGVGFLAYRRNNKPVLSAV